jgi:hypothetical protein
MFDLLLPPSVNPLNMIDHITYIVFIILSANALIGAPLVISLKLEDSEKKIFNRWLVALSFLLAISNLLFPSFLSLIGLPVRGFSGWEYVAFFVYAAPAALFLFLITILRVFSKTSEKIPSFLSSLLSIYLIGYSSIFIFESITNALRRW